MTLRPNLPPAYRLVVRDEVDSTNDEAKRLVAEGADDGTLVWARAQRRGRGRRGREWVSPPGNLYLSLVLRPECPPMEGAQIAFVTALAVADALSALVPPHSMIALKWPNDVLLNDLKAAGILLESSTTTPDKLDWLIVGVGVNVTSAPEDSASEATSLHAEGCGPVTPLEVIEGFGRHFLTWLNRWHDDGFGPVRKAWLGRAKGIGEAMTVNLESETVSGTFVDLDETGTLIVEISGGGRRPITAGDVFFGMSP